MNGTIFQLHLTIKLTDSDIVNLRAAHGGPFQDRDWLKRWAESQLAKGVAHANFLGNMTPRQRAHYDSLNGSADEV